MKFRNLFFMAFLLTGWQTKTGFASGDVVTAAYLTESGLGT